ncbi:hypothetical protein [Nocardioides pinisoli]|uniref:DUF222 domain-containing protein n=1 Tax=Nocardioides pinisoli TaxID=2950279 RepID=A0ABT1KRG6_9ACTN|nr:hypothetical protein [Nocardioides pinisoli]MCP3420335.1 hypothetical protein [Nocardioides pinisoli]
METLTAAAAAIRYAVETATVPTREGETPPWLKEEVVFSTSARDELQHTIDTAGRLASATDACDAEVSHQVGCENLSAAFAAIALKERLSEICRPRRHYVMDRDGTLRPIDPLT